MLYLAYKNLISKPLNTALSVLLLILSISLATFILQVKEQLHQHLEGNTKHFDMVIGAKGSPLQLVLSSILHIDNPTGNISFKEAKEMGKKASVKYTVPVSYGDNYKGYRILGTTHKYLDVYQAVLQSGRLYTKSFEAVIGSQVVKSTNLQLGDTFVSSHGLGESGVETHDEKPFTVTGILKPTGTIIDNLVITNLESIWEVHDHSDEEGHEEGEHDDHKKEEHHHEETEGHSEEDHDNHDKEEHDHDHDKEHSHDNHSSAENYTLIMEEGPQQNDHVKEKEHNHAEEDHGHADEETGKEKEHDHSKEHHDEEKEITSLLVKFRNPIGALQTTRFINEKSTMQAAIPKFEIDRLMKFLGIGFQTINGISIAILLIASLSIFINVIKTVRERKQELALLRTYGISTFQLIKLVFFEALILTILSAIFGWLLGRVGVWLFSVFSDTYGYDFVFNMPNTEEIYMLILVLLATLPAAIIASLSLLKLNVSKILADA
ncbi:FtsX-like permease family protein [Aquimarina litoralis]|uniref:ABC transporter permease n=1 Tax=Aquimarina litoralis TaxID=584605 RepID=UPI001C56ECB4|nr:ABC transporter permease [Aquimarina litoralis]MBW1296670.1 FtsX-like permease family protein [Aquimarina litoralis]